MTEATFTTAHRLLQTLREQGVHTVFGIPGNHNIELYRHLPESGIRHITARHEQGAAFMADGYARVTGKPGVAFVITGPGLTNAATAMGQALADSVPMVVIATVNDTEVSGREGRLHELPSQRATGESVALNTYLPATGSEAVNLLSQALHAHEHHRPGPCYLQIPISMLTAAAPPMVGSATPNSSLAQNDQALAVAADKLASSIRPIMLLGGGAQGASHAATSLAEWLDAVVINTVNGKGVVPATHPLCAGGSPSLDCVRTAVCEADVVLAAGTEFGETDFDLMMSGRLAFSGHLIRIDIDAGQVNLNRQPDTALVGDAADLFEQLLHQLRERRKGQESPTSGQPANSGLTPGGKRAKALRSAITRAPHYHPDFADFFATIDQVLPDATIVGDSTRPTYYASWMWEQNRPRRYFHSVTGFGTLGYALPAALGAQAALTAQNGDVGGQVVGIIGDGGLLFTVGELATGVAHKLAIKLIVWDNSGYQEIANSMAGAGIDTATTQFASPDITAIARAFGAAASAPENLRELAGALAERHDVPHVITVREEHFCHSPSGEWYGKGSKP